MNRFGWIRPGWNPPTTALMIIGFIIFWPIGLAVLAYILWGKRFRRGWRRHARPYESRQEGGHGPFDPEVLAESERLEAEREKLENERRAFGSTSQVSGKSSDAEEFERFTRERRSSGMASGESA